MVLFSYSVKASSGVSTSELLRHPHRVNLEAGSGHWAELALKAASNPFSRGCPEPHPDFSLNLSRLQNANT